MKKNIIGLLSLMMLLMAGIVYGACTFTTPTTSDILKGSEPFNVSCASADNAVNCTITLTSATSGSSVAIINLFNYTNSGNNATYDTVALIDAGDYVGAGTCYNLSRDAKTLTSRTGITIDNTVPGLASILPADGNKDTDGSISFSLTGTNATSSTLFIEGYPYSMTESSDAFSLTVEDLTNSVHSWYVTTSDGLNTTTSATYTFEISKQGGVFYDDAGEITFTPPTTTTANAKGFIGYLFNQFGKIIASIVGIFK